MTFIDSMSTCLKKYADFSGRASRSEYWWFTLFCNLVITGLMIMNKSLGTIAFFALLLPQFTAAARRMHDVGKTGWMMLVGLIPLVGALIVLYWCVLAGSDADNEFGPPAATEAD